jgi:glycosyltransferase involved in cell wall biosynthesis
MVIRAVQAASELTPDYEVIVVNDGSTDATAEVADELARTYPHVRVIHHPKNRGYGGALQTGIRSATKELIFYTDGDAQYDPAELALLWARLTPDADFVNGYKISRSDPLHRVIIGRLYHHIVSLLFGLKMRDVDCDFRLMRRSMFERIELVKSSGVICLEMMKKVQDAGFHIVEVPVHHFHRAFGKSQFFNFRRIFKTGVDVLRLWFVLVIRHQHRRSPATSVAPRPS